MKADAFKEFSLPEIAYRFYAIQPFIYDKSRVWWFWDEEKKYYEKADETGLLNELKKHFDNLNIYSSSTRTEIVNALKQEGRKRTPKPTKKTWIQFANTIIDYETEERFEATPNYFVTNPLPYNIGDFEETPTIDKLFKEWVGEEDYWTLYELIAYCMLSSYPLHRIFVLLGEGRNGKSSYLKILKKFIGEKNTCSTDFDLLLYGRFEKARLYKKLICEMGEINSAMIKKTNILKMLSGEDTIPIEFKGKDGFDFVNNAKIIIASNKLPESIDKSTGFYSRWLIVDFPNKFEEKKDLIEEIPEQEFENLSRKSLRVLKALMNRFKFGKDGSYQERALRYEKRCSPMNDFLAKFCVQEFAAETQLWVIKEAYVSYCASVNVNAVRDSVLVNTLVSKGFVVEKRHYEKDDGTRSTRRVVKGLRLLGGIDE